MGVIKGAGRDAARVAPAGRVRGARASFVLRRLGSGRLLPASLLFAILTSVAVTTALAGFGAAGHAVEYAVLDRAGRVQLPREMIDAHGMKDRVRLEQEPDHIGVWPDRDNRP